MHVVMKGVSRQNYMIFQGNVRFWQRTLILDLDIQIQVDGNGFRFDAPISKMALDFPFVFYFALTVGFPLAILVYCPPCK